MNTKNALQKAIDIVGLQPLAETLGCSYQAVRKWQKQNRMPDSEYSGRTINCLKIQEATGGAVTVKHLLGEIPRHVFEVNNG